MRSGCKKWRGEVNSELFSLSHIPILQCTFFVDSLSLLLLLVERCCLWLNIFVLFPGYKLPFWAVSWEHRGSRTFKIPFWLAVTFSGYLSPFPTHTLGEALCMLIVFTASKADRVEWLCKQCTFATGGWFPFQDVLNIQWLWSLELWSLLDPVLGS